MNIEIFPLDKVLIDGTAICLGMEQTAVEAAIGKGQLVRNRHYYFANEMAVEYSADNRVEFIEFLGGIEGNLRPVIYGVSAFDTPVDELAELLTQKNGGEADDPEDGYSLAFQEISVGVYREIRRANYWATIGVGTAGYYGMNFWQD